MHRDIVFNGKFLSAAPTGVHRVAEELIRHVDFALASNPNVASERRWRLLKPSDARRTLDTQVVAQQVSGVLTWQPGSSSNCHG